MSALSEEFNDWNPFALFAQLLQDLHIALGDEYESTPARWIRIARAEEHKDGVVAGGVINVVNTVADGLERLVEYTLTVRDVLEQLDPAKALMEASLPLWETLRDSNFREALMVIFSMSGATVPGTLMLMNGATDVVDKLLTYVPGPEDIVNVEQQLFNLLCVAYNAEGALDPERTGKLRLLQWVFQGDVQLYGLQKQNEEAIAPVDVSTLGLRRLTGNINYSIVENVKVEAVKNSIVIPLLDNSVAQDLDQLNKVLGNLNYLGVPPDFASFNPAAIANFQKENSLPLEKDNDGNTIVGNETINRLLNMDFGEHRLARAKRYSGTPITKEFGDLPLANWNAEAGGAHITGSPQLQQPDPEGYIDGYRYYDPSSSYNETDPKPWLADVTADPDLSSELLSTTLRFVALESRGRHPSLAPEHQVLNEGRAAYGRFFFCANDRFPKKLGQFTPPNDIARPPKGTIIRMYQWIDIRDYLPTWSGKSIYFRASALVRVLYQEKGTDRAQISLEQYSGSDYSDRFTKSLPKSQRLDVVRSNWFPENPPTAGGAKIKISKLVELNHRPWILLETPPMKLDLNAGALVVLLAGKHDIGWATDAFFDNVRVTYEIDGS